MSLLIGCHVSVKAPKMLVGAVEEAILNGANTFMFYIGAPQNTYRRPINEYKVDEAIQLMQGNNIDINNIIIHAPYIVNLANPKTSLFSIDFINKELKMVASIGCKYLVLHPGAHVGNGEEFGINELITNLNSILNNDQSNVTILIETMAGKGSEIGINLSELKKIIEGVSKKDKIGICLDTCHLHDSGVDLENFNSYLEEFDQLIGLNYLKCLHINDSKNELGSKKDRHENIGLGKIGFEKLIKIIYHEKLKNIPKILETPFINDLAPYKIEIKMIKAKQFDINAYDELGVRDDA